MMARGSAMPDKHPRRVTSALSGPARCTLTKPQQYLGPPPEAARERFPRKREATPAALQSRFRVVQLTGSQLSSFTLPCFTTRAHFACSLAMNCANFSRVPPPSSAP